MKECVNKATEIKKWENTTLTQKITRKEKPGMNIRCDKEKTQIYQQIH